MHRARIRGTPGIRTETAGSTRLMVTDTTWCAMRCTTGVCLHATVVCPIQCRTAGVTEARTRIKT